MANIFARTLFIWRLQTLEMTSKQIVLLPKLEGSQDRFLFISPPTVQTCVLSFHSQVKVLKSVPNQIQYKNMTTFKVLFVFFRHTANIGYIFR